MGSLRFLQIFIPHLESFVWAWAGRMKETRATKYLKCLTAMKCKAACQELSENMSAEQQDTEPSPPNIGTFLFLVRPEGSCNGVGDLRLGGTWANGRLTNLRVEVHTPCSYPAWFPNHLKRGIYPFWGMGMNISRPFGFICPRGM